MTCIVAVADGDRVWMGADRAAITDDHIAVREDPKVFVAKGFVLGFTSSFRMGDILKYHFSPPKRPAGMDMNEYMVVRFVERIRKCFKKHGFSTSERGADVGGQFLVGIEGRLFEIDSDYQVGECVHGYAAVGAGMRYALGSLVTTSEWDIAPNDRLEMALSAAERHCTAVRGPFLYKSA